MPPQCHFLAGFYQVATYIIEILLLTPHKHSVGVHEDSYADSKDETGYVK